MKIENASDDDIFDWSIELPLEESDQLYLESLNYPGASYEIKQRIEDNTTYRYLEFKCYADNSRLNKHTKLNNGGGAGVSVYIIGAPETYNRILEMQN